MNRCSDGCSGLILGHEPAQFLGRDIGPLVLVLERDDGDRDFCGGFAGHGFVRFRAANAPKARI